MPFYGASSRLGVVRVSTLCCGAGLLDTGIRRAGRDFTGGPALR